MQMVTRESCPHPDRTLIPGLGAQRPDAAVEQIASHTTTTAVIGSIPDDPPGRRDGQAAVLADPLARMATPPLLARLTARQLPLAPHHMSSTSARPPGSS